MFYMRYNTPVFFQRVEPGELNTETHNYGEDKITETKRYASVTDSGAETLKLMFSEIKQGCLIIRLQRPYTAAFDRVRIGNTIYTAKPKLNKRVFVLSEVQGNAENQG